MTNTRVNPIVENRYMGELLSNPEIPKAVAAVGYKILKGFRSDWGYCCYSAEQIAKFLKISIRTVFSAIKLLEKLGLLHIDRRYNRNHYIPLFDRYTKNYDFSAQQKYDNDGEIVEETEPEVVCNTLHSTGEPIMQPASQHSIEEHEASKPNGLSSSAPDSKKVYQNSTACASASDADLSVDEPEKVEKIKVLNWEQYREYSYSRTPLPRGFGDLGLRASINQFIKYMRRTREPWCGVRFATSRLQGWLSREKVRTNNEFYARYLPDYDDGYEDDGDLIPSY